MNGRSLQPKVHDVAVIGAGPIGIELACGLKQAGVDFIHFEAGAIGSTMLWWAPHTRFFSSPERLEIAGVPLVTLEQNKASREEYLAYLRAVVLQFDLRIQHYTRVVRIERAADSSFDLLTLPSAHGVGGPEELTRQNTATAQPIAESIDAQRWRFRNIILAIGDMHRPRMLNVLGEELPHVSHYLGDPHLYFRSRVLIVGGKNSAVEAAIRLYRCGARVAISYRGEQFDPKRVKYWLKPELEWLISKGRITFYPLTVVKQIHPRPGGVELIELDRQRDGLESSSNVQPRTVQADFVLLLTGYQQDTSLFEQLGVELGPPPERAPRVDLHTMQTSVPSVYVAGTAAGGSQSRARLFIENSHVHVHRIVKAIAGIDLPWRSMDEYSTLEES